MSSDLTQKSKSISRTNICIVEEADGTVHAFLEGMEITGVLAVAYPVFPEGEPLVGKESVVLTLHRPEVVFQQTSIETFSVKKNLH